MSPVLKLFIVRHGRTEYNAKGFIQGQLDIPLNDFGRGQAKASSELFKDITIDEVWSSTLSRAKVTAQIIVQHHPPVVMKTDERLKERGMGSWEGLHDEDVEDQAEPLDAETYGATTARLADWLSDIWASHLSNDSSKNILVVTHEDCISSLARFLKSIAADSGSNATNLEVEFGKGVKLVHGSPNLGVGTVEFVRTDSKEGAWKATVLGWAKEGPA